MEKAQIIKTLTELRKDKKRNFSQSVDLIINLKSFDIKKDSVNLFLTLPHKVKEVKVGAFMNRKVPHVDTITKEEFDKYKNKKEAKNLAKKYDFFIASASLMPQIATIFGRYLGPLGKMPSPQLGIITEETESKINDVLKKMEKVVRVKSKEPSLKFCVGKEDMKDEDISDNIMYAYNAVINALPKNKDNLRSVMIKLTMGKPVKLE